jgi:8-oxo-dGTP pyrophosphatase MutT (NUDIX family)
MVYRISDRVVKFLLVGPKKDRPNEWFLPKGHIENGETPGQTALREVCEETGVTARIVCPLETLEFKAKGNTVRAVFYLMELISEAEPIEKRRREWFSLEDAVAHATHPDTKELLKKAASRVETGGTAEPSGP